MMCVCVIYLRLNFCRLVFIVDDLSISEILVGLPFFQGVEITIRWIQDIFFPRIYMGSASNGYFYFSQEM